MEWFQEGFLTSKGEVKICYRFPTFLSVRKSSNMGTGYEKSPHFAGIEKIL